MLDDDPGHDIEHCLRVAGWTLRCGGAANTWVAPLRDGIPTPAECGADATPGRCRPTVTSLRSSIDAREAIAAALLHDVVNVPKDDPRRSEASALSALEARPILVAFGFDATAVDRIADAIEDHSYSRGATPRSALGRALQDADRLESLGVLALFRTVSTGTRMGARYFDGADPWAEERPLDDKRFNVDHFFTKVLRLHETMQTDVGRREARRRTAVLERILDDLADELGRPRPER